MKKKREGQGWKGGRRVHQKKTGKTRGLFSSEPNEGTREICEGERRGEERRGAGKGREGKGTQHGQGDEDHLRRDLPAAAKKVL